MTFYNARLPSAEYALHVRAYLKSMGGYDGRVGEFAPNEGAPEHKCD